MNVTESRLSSRRRRVVVIGLGSIGRRHARLLRDRPDIAVEVCEPSDAVLAAAALQIDGLPVHRELAAALATRPDGVLVAQRARPDAGLRAPAPVDDSSELRPDAAACHWTDFTAAPAPVAAPS